MQINTNQIVFGILLVVYLILSIQIIGLIIVCTIGLITIPIGIVLGWVWYSLGKWIIKNLKHA